MPSWRTVAESCVALTMVAGLVLPATLTWTPVCVEGGSMRPALHPGDLAIVAKGRAPHRGDIVLARVSTGLLLHRVSAVRSDWRLVLRGDANNVADRTPVAKGRIQGVVVRVVPVGAMLSRWKRV